ncbi:MAG: MCE family protein [Propionivibrio sp.]|nr:MCE family protein [Propionivibrio sp.]
MENRSHALIAGLFTLFFGISAVAALWWFGGDKEVSVEYLVLTTKNVTGLNVQAPVRYRGVSVGKVESVELDPNDVRNTLVRIRIKKTIPVTRGTTAKLGYQGITGLAHVLLEDTGKDATLLEANSGGLPTIPMQDSLVEELSDVGGDTLRNARDFLLSANALLSPENRLNITKTLSHLEDTTGNAKVVVAQLRQILTPENVRLINATLTRVEQTASQTAPFVAEARALVAHLQTVSGKLETVLGDPVSGGAGALIPRINALSAELSANSRQLGRVLQMLEESPQSLIFGHQQPLPGPGEPGFNAPITTGGQP